MRKNLLFTGLALILGISIFTAQTKADDNLTAISNISITMREDYVTINWDGLDNSAKSQLDGYAVAWGDSTFAVRNDKVARQYLTSFSNSLELWAKVTFDQDEWHYTRVFGYSKREDRGYDHLYGSKILKWKYDRDRNIESEIIDPSDVNVTFEYGASSSSEDNSIFDFGILRATAFDTIIRFAWSRPDLADNEYDGFVITLSEKSDLSDPILEADIDEDFFKARIDGLKPGTTYFAAGEFQKNGKRFGKSDTVTVKTAPLLDQNGKQRLQRRLKAIGASEGFGTIIDAQQYEDDAVANETTTSSSSTSTSSTTTPSRTSSRVTTTQTTRTDFDIPDNSSDINAELRKLRVEIGTLKRYQLRLLLRLREIQSGN